ncbi:hypothetical protein ACFLW6_00995 [Chloroflexota bacterium]
MVYHQGFKGRLLPPVNLIAPYLACQRILDTRIHVPSERRQMDGTTSDASRHYAASNRAFSNQRPEPGSLNEPGVSPLEAEPDRQRVPHAFFFRRF